MKITESRNTQIQTYGTDASESTDKISTQKSQETGQVQTEKTAETKSVSQSEVSSKKAELGMAGQAQAAALRKQTNKGTSVQYKMDYGGGLYPHLKKHSEGKEVLALQKRLNEDRLQKGLPPIKEDGVFGNKTEQAVTEYQQYIDDQNWERKIKGDNDAIEYNVRPTGEVDPETAKSLGASPRFQYGCEGDDVQKLQEDLNLYRESKGLPPIKEDGKFRSETEKAVRQYQKDHEKEGLKVDGKAGSETLRSIDQELGGDEWHKEFQDDSNQTHLDPTHSGAAKELESDHGNKIESQPKEPQVKEPSLGDSTKLGGLSYDDLKETASSVKKDAEKLAEYANPFRVGEKVGEQVRPLVKEAEKTIEELDPFRPLGIDSSTSHKLE